MASAVLAGCSVAAPKVAPAPKTAHKASPVVLAAGHLVALPDAGVALVAPADGRLVGPGFYATVLGAARVSSVDDAGLVHKAPAGDTLEVFSIQVRRTTGGTFALTGAVQAGTSRLSLPPADLAPGTHSFAVAVPRNRGVVLDLSSGGVTQGFSLTDGKRASPQVLAYYRNPTGSSLVDQVDQTQTLAAKNEADGFQAATSFTVSSATLSYLSPLGVPAASPDEGFVVLSAKDAYVPNQAVAATGACGYFASFGALAPNRLQLILPGGKSVPALHTGPAAPVEFGYGSGLLQGTYYFAVPADLTSARLVITPGTVPGVEYNSCTGIPARVTYTGQATFDLSFPKLPPPVVPATGAGTGAGVGSGTAAVTTTATTAGGARQREAAAPAPISSSSDTGPIAGGVVGALIVALAATVLVLRRRRTGAEDEERPRPTTAQMGGSAPGGGQGHPDTTGGADEDLGDGDYGGAGDGVRVLSGAVADPRSDLGATPGAQPDVPTRAEGLAAQPAAPEPPAGDVVVKVLGPVEVSGWRARPPRRKLTELVAYLALHAGEAVSGEALRLALWPLDEEEVSAETLRSYISQARGGLGAEHLPEADGAGYRLGPGVSTDWAAFSEAVRASKDASPRDAARLLHEALELVRGVPFTGSPARSYEWAYRELWASAMEEAITSAASALAEMAIGRGDLEEATWAIRQGLLGVPHAEALYADLLEAAAASGDRRALDAAHRDASRALEGHARGDIDALHRRLVDELVRRRARKTGRDAPGRDSPGRSEA